MSSIIIASLFDKSTNTYVNMQNTKKNKPTKKYLREVKTWGTNSAKWNAAEEFCRDRGWQFKIITERELGIK